MKTTLLYAWFGVCLAVNAQVLLPTNGFNRAAATSNPIENWHLAEGSGRMVAGTQLQPACLQVEGNGNDQAFWRFDYPSIVPGEIYRFHFTGRRLPGAAGGGAITGFNLVNRDFGLSENWETHSFVARVPDQVRDFYGRLGQWHVNGTMQFTSAALYPAKAVHHRENGLELGEGEGISDGVYWFQPHFSWEGANYHRPLIYSTASFNSDRWVFSPSQELVYALRTGSVPQKSAQIQVAINYFEGGELRVEASRDRQKWLMVDELGKTNRSASVALPTALFPATDIFVRLRHSASSGAFQVNAIDYQAKLEGNPPDLRGSTRFMNVLASSPELVVQLEQVELAPDRGSWQVQLALTPQNPSFSELQCEIGRLNATNSLAKPRFKPIATQIPIKTATRTATAQTKSIHVTMNCPVGQPGLDSLDLYLTADGKKVLFHGQIPVQLNFLDDREPGYWLAETPTMGLWWCESGWKIGRERGLPARPSRSQIKPVTAALARGEYEPVQFVLRPTAATQLLAVNWRPNDSSKTAAQSLQATFNQVGYIQVTRPTDTTCQPGWYPDPLPPLSLPFALKPNENQPLWITFFAPTSCPPGKIKGHIEIKTTTGEWHVPVQLTVHDFTLPRETHLQSALGLNSMAINEYHGLARPEDQEAVYEKYLRNFARHRISPYSFYDYAPMQVKFEGQGEARRTRIDFTQFDRAAARWLDEYQFSTFQLRLLGMGGGTFQSRALGQLEGFQEGTPEHARLFQDYLGQVERHLREHGWLAKAFTYWFDEPDPKDYEFVVAGMKRLKAAAPQLSRMLTEQPEPALMGNVDIWCGLTPEWSREKVAARRAVGERVWWYICCAPTAPYLTEFIDHPGNELRLWPWQSWQYGVTGLLIWETTYWNSPLVTRAPAHQDPYRDPMSYVSGYDFPVGHVGYWGNGDGRFLYPPLAGSAKPSSPCLDDPVNSIRWENLRDGMEDYEYFWRLQQEIQRLESAPRNTRTQKLLTEARALLAVPASVSQDTTHFATDPRPLLQHRERLAKMIEKCAQVGK